MTDAPPLNPAGASPLSHLRQGRVRASVSGVAWSLVTVALSTGLGLIVYVVTSRALQPDDFGLVAFGLGIVMFVSCLVPFGFGGALTQRGELSEAHLDSVFWLCTLAALAAYGALLLAALPLERLTGTPGLAPVLAAVGTRIVWDSLTIVPTAVVLRRMSYRTFALRSGLAYALGGMICLLLVWWGAGHWALVASQVVGSFITAAVMLASCGWRPRLVLDRGSLRQLASFGLFSSGVRAITEMRLDQIVLGLLAGPVALGLYFFARRLWQLLLDFTVGVFSPVTSVLFASMQNEPEKAREAFLLTAFVVATAGLPLFAGLVAVAETAIPLVFGEHWRDAVLPLQALSVIGLAAVVGVVQATLINGQGHAGWWLGYQSVGQLGNVLVVLLVYPSHGLVGVTVAMAALTFLIWPVSIRKTLRLLDLSFAAYARSLAGPVLATAIMFLAIKLLPSIGLELTGWPRLGAEVGTGVVAYSLATILLSGPDLRRIAIVLRNRRRESA